MRWTKLLAREPSWKSQGRGDEVLMKKSVKARPDLRAFAGGFLAGPVKSTKSTTFPHTRASSPYAHRSRRKPVSPQTIPCLSALSYSLRASLVFFRVYQYPSEGTQSNIVSTNPHSNLKCHNCPRKPAINRSIRRKSLRNPMRLKSGLISATFKQHV